MKFKMANKNQNQEIDEDVWIFVKEEWKKLREDWISEEEQTEDEEEKRQAEEKIRIDKMWKNDKLNKWEWKRRGPRKENTKDSSTQTIRYSEISETLIMNMKNEVPKVVIVKVKDTSIQTDPSDFLEPLLGASLEATMVPLTESKPSSPKNHQFETPFKPKLSPLPETKDEYPKKVNSSQKKKEVICWNCGGPFHDFRNCVIPRINCFCFNCGEPGKTLINCPRCSKKKYKKFCFRCGIPGVTTPTCPNCTEPREFTEKP